MEGEKKWREKSTQNNKQLKLHTERDGGERDE